MHSLIDLTPQKSPGSHMSALELAEEVKSTPWLREANLESLTHLVSQDNGGGISVSCGETRKDTRILSVWGVGIPQSLQE